MNEPVWSSRALGVLMTLRHLQERSGTEVQGELVQALIELLVHTPEARTPMEETSALAVV
jgi:hypothetical protein